MGDGQGEGIGLDSSGCRRLVGVRQLAGFSGVVVTVHSSGVSAASFVAGGFARVVLGHVWATNPTFGRHGCVCQY